MSKNDSLDYELGQVMAYERIERDILEKAAQNFIAKNDQVAGILRNLGNVIGDEARRMRKELPKEYH